ncbi:MAG: hypothetical protein RIC06_15045 [Cyclobacteriaceae bacterium]
MKNALITIFLLLTINVLSVADPVEKRFKNYKDTISALANKIWMDVQYSGTTEKKLIDSLNNYARKAVKHNLFNRPKKQEINLLVVEFLAMENLIGKLTESKKETSEKRDKILCSDKIAKSTLTKIKLEGLIDDLENCRAVENPDWGTLERQNILERQNEARESYEDHLKEIDLELSVLIKAEQQLIIDFKSEWDKVSAELSYIQKRIEITEQQLYDIYLELESKL